MKFIVSVFSIKTPLLKSILMMKMVLFLLIASCIQVQAAGQKVSLSKTNAPLKEIFKSIEKQSDFLFMYETGLIKSDMKGTVIVRDADIKQVMNECLKGTSLGYTIVGKSILINKNADNINKEVSNPEQKPFLDRIITGRITDLRGNPLEGASVFIKSNDKIGTITNKDGKYTIVLPSDAKVLRVNFIGFKSVDIILNEKSVFDVRLEPGTTQMEDVVITGYQQIDRRSNTSAITTLDATELLVPGMTSIDQLLEGRVPELVLMSNSGEVGSTPRIRVRGTSTLLGNREPLWVLDGFIMQDPVKVSNDDLNNPDYLNIIGNAIAGINPQDIERIDILKDASATALYGTRAANGVIVVTTKKGAIGPARFSFNNSLKFTRRPSYSDKNINLMNSQERVKFGKDLSDLHYQFPSNRPLVGYEGAIQRYYKGVNSYEDFLKEVTWYETVNTDWFDVLTRNTLSQDNTFGVSGGSNNIRYYASLGYNAEQGVTKGTNGSRYTSRVNLDFSLSNKLKANISLNGNTQKKSNLIGDLNAMDYAYNTTRALPFTNPDGSLFYYGNLGYGGMNRRLSTFDYNIVNEMDNSSNTYDGSTLGASLSLRYSVLKKLSLSVAGNYSNSNTLLEQWWGEQSHYVARLKNGEYEDVPKSGDLGYSILPYGGLLKTNNSKSEAFTVRQQSDFRTYLGKNNHHFVSALLGFELNGRTSRTFSDENRGFVQDRGLQFVDNINLDLYPYYKTWINENHRFIGYDIDRQVSSYFSTSYTYKNNFTLNANTRVDASNKFGSRSNERFLPVWSVSGMINLKDVLLKDFDVISDLRMRTSVGLQGNMLDDQSPNLIIKMGTINPLYNENTSSIARYPNPNLLWEQTMQFNLGLDLSLFENRLTIGSNFYKKKTKDAFTTVQVSSVNGVSGNAYVMNGGNLENTGYSISLNGKPIKTRDFQWGVSTYFSGNFNIVKSGMVDVFRLDDFLNGRAMVSGTPIGTFFSYKYLGLNPGNGAPVFDDFADRRHLLEFKNLEETIMMTTVNSGQREPVFTGSVANTFKFKRFTLSTNLTYSIGSKIRLFPMYGPIMEGVSSEINVRKEFTQRWMVPGDENFTNIPAIIGPSDPDYWNYNGHFSGANGPIKTIEQFARNIWDMYDKSDLRVVSGNYLKMSSLTFRYALGPDFLKKTPFSNAQMSLNGINIFTIAAKELNGQDPTQAGFAKPNLSIRPSYTFQFNVTF